MAREASLFDSVRLTLEESLELTAQSLNAYGAGHPHWVIAYSGGKDSTSLLVAVDHLIQAGRVRRPERVTLYVRYAPLPQEGGLVAGLEALGIPWRPGEVSVANYSSLEGVLRGRSPVGTERSHACSPGGGHA